jgi:hypothetical protein
MKHDVRCAITLSRRSAEIEPVPGFTGTPVAYFARGRDDLNADQGILQAKRIQNPGSVGAKLDASSSLFEHGRLFVHFDIDTAPEERQRCGEPANAAANYCDLYRRHLRALHVDVPNGLLRFERRRCQHVIGDASRMSLSRRAGFTGTSSIRMP